MKPDAQLVISLIVLAAIIFSVLMFLAWAAWQGLVRLFDYALERYTRWKRRRFECRVGYVYRTH